MQMLSIPIISNKLQKKENKKKLCNFYSSIKKSTRKQKILEYKKKNSLKEENSNITLKVKNSNGLSATMKILSQKRGRMYIKPIFEKNSYRMISNYHHQIFKNEEIPLSNFERRKFY